jgi:hypothetical protein
LPNVSEEWIPAAGMTQKKEFCMDSKKLEVHSSPIKGKGSFACINLTKGDHITTFSGELFSLEAIDEVCAIKGISDDDPLQVDVDKFLILNEESRVINHNCNPNAGLRNAIELYAIADIKIGDEITFDYSTTVGLNIKWSMPCLCGASNCRKIIANALSIPEVIREKYLALNVFPEFIKQQFHEHAETAHR